MHAIFRLIVNADTKQEEQQNAPDRWTLIRDLVVFQVKLAFDAMRDLLLVPISIGAGIVSLLKSGDGPGTEFYDLLRFGRRSERWINLFGAADNIPDSNISADPFPGEDVDELVHKVESFVVAEYRKGGMTAQAKDRLDRAINTLHRMGKRSEKTGAPPDE